MKRIIFFFLFSLCLNLSAQTLKDDRGELKPSAAALVELFDLSSNVEMDELVTTLQNKWMQPGKEKWEMQERYEDMREEAFPVLKELGCIHALRAPKTRYDYALLMGSLGKTMQRRLDFLFEEWQRGVRFDRIVLLTGQRDLDETREIFPEGLSTETELFIYLFNHHALKEVAKFIPVTIIDSAQIELGNGRTMRPNTASTVKDWLATGPKAGRCLVVSTQPFVGYQEAVVKHFLPRAFDVDGIGPGTYSDYPTANLDLETARNPYPMAVYLDTFAKWLTYEHLSDLK